MVFITYIGPLMIDFRDHQSGGTRHSSLQHHCQRSAKSWARQTQRIQTEWEKPGAAVWIHEKNSQNLGDLDLDGMIK